ncbi:MAG: sigma-54 dependent transcriptional regulator [Candidatus Acidiferrum sp.]
MPSPKPRNGSRIEPIDLLPPDEVLFGASAAMAEVRTLAAKVCKINAPVLLCGDGGTGKEAVARWIHRHSRNAGGQFVKVNCAAIPGTLLESELFGYEKGAFTGAHVSKPGRVELAQNGTLFLDEIGDLDSGLQSKLLQFLQDGSFSRIGGEEEKSVEMRLICATNKNLQDEINAGTFRVDLFYRINVVRIRLPRLRERSEDIPMIAEYFRTQFQEQFTRPAEPLSKPMLQYLQNLNWPGNMRELSNEIARYVLTGPESINLPAGPQSTAHSGAQAQAQPNGAAPLKNFYKDAIRQMEWNIILETLRAHRWNRRKTAQALKISYRALLQKIQAAGFVERKLGTATVEKGAEDRPI